MSLSTEGAYRFAICPYLGSKEFMAGLFLFKIVG